MAQRFLKRHDQPGASEYRSALAAHKHIFQSPLSFGYAGQARDPSCGFGTT